MPCFLLTLENKNQVYQLSDMITSQYDNDPAVSETWLELRVQASMDNFDGDTPVGIKYGDAELSGLRYGRILAPGDLITWNLGTARVSTKGRYFLCEEMDGAQIAVELVGV